MISFTKPRQAPPDHGIMSERCFLLLYSPDVYTIVWLAAGTADTAAKMKAVTAILAIGLVCESHQSILRIHIPLYLPVTASSGSDGLGHAVHSWCQK